MTELDELKTYIVELEFDEVSKRLPKLLESNEANLILNIMSEAMLEVGKLYEEKEYYLPELVLAGEIMEDGLAILKPHLEKNSISKKGKIIAATVKGDLHDIGKNIAVTLLSASGFDVIDLGKDVDAKEICKAAIKHNADIIALSALLTMTVGEISKVVQELETEGIRNRVKVICGGAPINQEIAEKFGADIACDDAIVGISVCTEIMNSKK